ncbi:hypothetical protein [Trichormus variabilis]|uniref:Uncharacterized protein n=1 Tax=Trichormus variabilis SAG 1403-4b TaxID=447716 RepID=A0A433V0R9_ANAVA|nr:hypothetical protein [Trichormus variabilis]MBD2625342.1 hypothetical protein [Trichormus variabilis FACHB-164]RUS99715.1 hypothetical protein DSM107003_02990 [Trichormus variabilis SAG 1403-4b]
MKTKHFLAITLLSVAGIIPYSSVVLAEEITCRSTLRAITVDNVRVPSGATCILSGTNVKGTVKVESNATLKASKVNVIGNIQAENAKNVVVDSSSVIGGNIQIKKSRAANIINSRIKQDLQFEENAAKLAASGNTIGGNLQAFKNTGGITIRNNKIDGNLQCKENRPAPTGGSNIVKGNKEDQCSRL